MGLDGNPDLGITSRTMPNTKIEKLRKKKGWSLRDLAYNAGLSERTVDALETKPFPRPPFLKTQIKIADALGVTVSTIFKSDRPR